VLSHKEHQFVSAKQFNRGALKEDNSMKCLQDATSD